MKQETIIITTSIFILFYSILIPLLLNIRNNKKIKQITLENNDLRLLDSKLSDRLISKNRELINIINKDIIDLGKQMILINNLEKQIKNLEKQITDFEKINLEDNQKYEKGLTKIREHYERLLNNYTSRTDLKLYCKQSYLNGKSKIGVPFKEWYIELVNSLKS